MKYIKILPLLLLLGCKLDEPKVLEKYDCQLPTIIAVTKDPVNGKKFSFAVSPSTADVASLKWTIKNASGSIVNSSNLSAYSLTLANEGNYTVQAELVSKCGESKTLSAEIEAYGYCNLTKRDFYFKLSDGSFEVTVNDTYFYNAANEIIREESFDNSNGQRYLSRYEKTEANLGSLTKPFIVRNDFDNYYCDLQKRVVKEVYGSDIILYSYGNDGFLEQEVRNNTDPQNSESNIERIRKYKYSSTGMTETSIRYDKTTKLSQISIELVYIYSDKIKSPKYARNYGYNYGKRLPYYFKNEVYSSYDYSKSTTPTIKTSNGDDYVTILDKNNQPISEKTIALNSYLIEYRNFVYDCK
jgi:hypothetical protein